MKKSLFYLLFLLTFIPINVLSQTDSSLYLSDSEFRYANNPRYTLMGHNPYRETDIQPLPTIIFTGAVAGILTGQHIMQMNTIWKEQTHFRIIEDGSYALYSDKLGHFYGAYIVSSFVREGFYASGMSHKTATVTSALVGLGYETYVEIMDGFGSNWGFSPSDFYFDAAGAAFFVAQEYVPYLQNFTPKFMYFPSDWHGEKKRDHAEMFIDDYSSQTFWLSINVHNMLPTKLQQYWPAWMQLSVGYAARNLCDLSLHGTCDPEYSPKVTEWTYGRRKIIVSLDYNLVELLPDGCNTWNWFKQGLNYVKFPSPAVEFDLEGGPTKFMLVYPFQLW